MCCFVECEKIGAAVTDSLFLDISVMVTGEKKAAIRCGSCEDDCPLACGGSLADQRPLVPKTVMYFLDNMSLRQSGSPQTTCL